MRVRISSGVGQAVALGALLAACSRTPAGGGSSPGTAGPQPAPVPPPAAAARRPEPFTHPLLAEAAVKIVDQDCTAEALAATVGRIRFTTAQAAPLARKRGPAKPRPEAGCATPEAEPLGAYVRQLEGRVSACVAKDAPLDAQWDLANSAVLSLGLCLDCARPPEERAARCRRALDILASIPTAKAR